MKAVVVMLIEMEVDDLTKGSPTVERISAVVSVVAETIRHRSAGPGVVVGDGKRIRESFAEDLIARGVDEIG